MIKRNDNKGFTLIELLVVISIIGLLASVVLASLNSARTKAQVIRVTTNVKNYERGLELFFDTHSRYPGEDTTAYCLGSIAPGSTG